MRGVSVGELAVLALLSLPVGLLFGCGLALLIMATITLVSRMLAKLDLVGVLKARD